MVAAYHDGLVRLQIQFHQQVLVQGVDRDLGVHQGGVHPLAVFPGFRAGEELRRPWPNNRYFRRNRPLRIVDDVLSLRDKPIRPADFFQHIQLPAKGVPFFPFRPVGVPINHLCPPRYSRQGTLDGCTPVGLYIHCKPLSPEPLQAPAHVAKVAVPLPDPGIAVRGFVDKAVVRIFIEIEKAEAVPAHQERVPAQGVGVHILACRRHRFLQGLEQPCRSLAIVFPRVVLEQIPAMFRKPMFFLNLHFTAAFPGPNKVPQSLLSLRQVLGGSLRRRFLWLFDFLQLQEDRVRTLVLLIQIEGRPNGFVHPLACLQNLLLQNGFPIPETRLPIPVSGSDLRPVLCPEILQSPAIGLHEFPKIFPAIFTRALVGLPFGRTIKNTPDLVHRQRPHLPDRQLPHLLHQGIHCSLHPPRNPLQIRRMVRATVPRAPPRSLPVRPLHHADGVAGGMCNPHPRKVRPDPRATFDLFQHKIRQRPGPVDPQ